MGGVKNSRVYKQGPIWRFIQARPEGATRRMVMEHFGMTGSAASNQLQRLLHKGSARRVGSTRWPTWYATDTPPEDRRGCNPGSMAALWKGQKDWRKGLVAAAVARGRDPSKLQTKQKRKPRPPRYLPATELEKCWLMPIPRIAPANDGSYLAGEAASGDNVQAVP